MQTRTLNALYQKKLNITVQTMDEYAIQAVPITFKFSDFENYVQENFNLWTKITNDTDSNKCLLFWLCIQEALDNGFRKALKRSSKDKISQINDILDELKLPALDTVEEQEIEDYSITIERTLLVPSPSPRDQYFNAIYEFTNYGFVRLSRISQVDQLNEALINYIKYTKEPGLIYSYLNSSFASQSIPALYCLREYILETEKDWNKITKATIDTYKDTLSQALNEEKSTIDDIANYATEIQEKFELKMSSWDKLTDAYEEKLKFEAPELLWNEQAEKYSETMKLLTFLTLLISFLFIIAVSVITPKMFEIQHNALLLSPAAILLATITFVVYIIRVLIKQIQSCRHLQIICTERAALTRFYQALIYKNGSSSITDQERVIIFKALFEVADSGLVKGSGGESIDGLLAALLKKP